MSRARHARWARFGQSLSRTAQPLTISVLAVIVAGSVMAIGAVHPPVLGLVAAASAIALGGAFLLGPRRLRELPPVALVFWMLALYSVVQLIPLPLSLLAKLAPTNADVWARALLPVGEAPPRFAPISLDPGATWIEVARWLSYGCVAVASAAIARRRGLRWAALLVHGAALAAAVVTIGHGLVGATEVFGVYTPSSRPQPWHVGPLLNPNNLAGLLNVGALCGLGLVVDEDPPVPRWALAPATATIVAISIASASRAGVLMLIVGVVAFALVTEYARSRRRVSSKLVRRARWIGSAALALGVALTFLGTRRSVWVELLDENLGKLAIVGSSASSIGDHLWFGMGRGTFESAFAAFTPRGTSVTITHAENFVVQWLAEWGVIVGGLGLIAMIYLMRPRRYGVARTPIAAGVWLAILVLVVHNLVDLGLEIPALCLAAALLLGALDGNKNRQRAVEDVGIDVRPREVILAALSATSVMMVIAVLCTWRGYHDLPGDKLQMASRLALQPSPRTPAIRDNIRAELREAMARHPAEPYFPLVGALLAWEERDQDPLPWIQRSLERRMNYGGTHLLLAMVLERAGARTQALLELRLAIESDPQILAHASRLAIRWAGDDIDALSRVVPASGAAMAWDSLGGYAGDRAIGAQCDDRALALDPSRTAPRWRLAQDVIERRKRGGCTESDEDRCAQEVEAHAQQIERAAPQSSLAVQLRAGWLSAVGNHVEAEAMLRRRCNEFRELTMCLRLRAMIAAELEDDAVFADAVTSLRHASCLDAERCAGVNTWIGDTYVGRGDHAAAVAAYERANRERPTDERLVKLANAASAAGLDAQALQALERIPAARRSHELSERIKALRRKVASQVVNR